MKIGLIGCGRVSKLHLCAYKHIKEANVVAVSDINYDAAKNVAKSYGIKYAFGDYTKIFEMKDLDFVDICTPTLTHADIACEAAKFGQNILLEKPMARHSKDCDRIVHEVTRNRVKFCVCHNQLFIPHVMHMKEMIDSGAFDLMYLRTSTFENTGVFGPAVSWVTKPESGGVLWESGLHLAYLQLHFLKNITEVVATGIKIEYPVHDQFAVLLRTNKKAIGVLEVSLFAKRKEALFEFLSSDSKRMRIINYSVLANLSENPSNFLQGIYSDSKVALNRWVGPIINNVRLRELLTCLHHYNLIKQFMQSIKNDSDPPIKPEDGRRTIQLLECIQQSLDTNQPVRTNNYFS